MIDREARDQMAQAVCAYMNEEITAFHFDESLSEVGTGTKDKTVRLVGRALWFHYDDCKDHKIVASKEEWDLFNRLLLLLESDAEMEMTRTWGEWHPLHWVAALLFMVFLPSSCASVSGLACSRMRCRLVRHPCSLHG